MSDGKYTYVIPKQLKLEDQISISGIMTSNPSRLNISLMTGSSSPDYQNIVCDVEANFVTNSFTLKTVTNGYAEEIVGIHQSFAVTDLLIDSEFQFRFSTFGDDYTRGYFLTVYIGQSFLNRIQLKHNLGDIRFLQLDGDIEKVDKLSFQYS